jgi:hypothetical protein
MLGEKLVCRRASPRALRNGVQRVTSQRSPPRTVGRVKRKPRIGRLKGDFMAPSKN